MVRNVSRRDQDGGGAKVAADVLPKVSALASDISLFRDPPRQTSETWSWQVRGICR
jgi:hypothetical protein